MRRRLKRAAQKIIWRWGDIGYKGRPSKPFVLTEAKAIQVDKMVDELWRWKHSQKFMDGGEQRFAARFLALERELKELNDIYQEYRMRVAKIEKATGVEFPGIFGSGPTLGGEDEEGTYYQVVDGTIEKN